MKFNLIIATVIRNDEKIYLLNMKKQFFDSRGEKRSLSGAKPRLFIKVYRQIAKSESKFIFISLLSIFCCNIIATAQSFSQFSGSVFLNSNFYLRDTTINASGNNFYDNLKAGGESWFDLKYNSDFINAGMRFDLFANSNRIFPNNEYSEQGIGNWFINKQIDRLNLTAGYFYEQFGAGSIFRAYEERLLGLDRAIMGIKAKYEISENAEITAFMGRQKLLFELSEPILKGLQVNTYNTIKNIYLNTSVALVNRTLDVATIQTIASDINRQPLASRFVPKHNVYAISLYNSFSSGNFTWLLEASVKSNEAIQTLPNTWENLSGNFLYSSLSYSQKGLGVTFQAKRTQNFALRTDPLEQILQNNVALNFLPAINREHSLARLAIYNAQALELDEMAFSIDAIINPTKLFQLKTETNFNIQISFSNISNRALDSLYYREFFIETEIRKPKSPIQYHFGVQILDQNQAIYAQKGKYINALVPFAEITYKFNRRNSIRFEGEYQMLQRKTRFSEGFDAKKFKQDRNDWISGLLELNLSPHWSFAINDMYNINPADEDAEPDKNILKQHFYGIYTAYKNKAQKYSIFYGRRVDGIVCVGGVCRYEPAFSGLQFQLSANF